MFHQPYSFNMENKLVAAFEEFKYIFGQIGARQPSELKFLTEEYVRMERKYLAPRTENMNGEINETGMELENEVSVIFFNIYIVVYFCIWRRKSQRKEPISKGG